MKIGNWTVAAIAGLLLAGASHSKAQSETNNAPDIAALKQQIQQLQKKVDDFERRRQTAHAAATNTASPCLANLTVGANGVSFNSADSNFVANLHAWVQLDSRTFFKSGSVPGIDGFLLRRARIIIQGTLFHDFDYDLTPEFAGNSPQILDAYLNYHAIPAFQLEAGKFKPPVGIEALEPDVYTFFNERSMVSDLAPYRGIGVELHGDLFDNCLSYAAGVFNGLPDLTGTTINANYDNEVAFACRLFARPFKNTAIVPLRGLGIGVSGSYERDNTNAAAAGLTPGFTSDGQEKFFTYSSSTVPHGEHWRISPQGCYYWGPFGILSEYIVSDQQVEKVTAPESSVNLRNMAWQFSAGWILTGERDSYNGVSPQHPFNLHNGSWGAWQLAGRYARLNVDDAAFPEFASLTASASQAEEWAVGVNWYLNADLRANLSFSRTTFAGGSSGAVTRHAENVLFTRLQLAF